MMSGPVETMPAPMPYEPALDGIRALAITSVVFFHAFPTVLVGGWAGVDVFFVLSGYLITRLLAQELWAGDTINFRFFYIRRALRLLPAFGALLLFQLLRIALEGNPVLARQMLEATFISATYLINWSRAFQWLPQDVLGHTWSLAMEEQFYLLWPVSLLLIWKRRPLAWLYGAIALIIVWRCALALTGSDPERTYNGFDTHADALLVGCVLALLPAGTPLLAQMRRFPAVPLAALLAIFLFLPHRTVLTQTFGLTIAALCAAWLVVAAGADTWLKRLMSLKPLTYTGRISYGWYLWHFPILMIGLNNLPGLSAWGKAGLVLSAYPVAMASYHFIERPFLALRPRFRAAPAAETMTPPPAGVAQMS